MSKKKKEALEIKNTKQDSGKKLHVDYTKITVHDVKKYQYEALFLFEANERNYAKDALGFTMFGWTGQAGAYGIEALRLGCGIGIRASFDQKPPQTLNDFKNMLEQELQRIDKFLGANKKTEFLFLLMHREKLQLARIRKILLLSR